MVAQADPDLGLNAASLLSLNGVQKCDRFSGPTLDVQLNACISAAATNGAGAQGIADATGLRTGTIAAQVNVGNTNGVPQIVLFLPKAATWQVSITDGTSCAIMLYNKSAMIGTGNQGNGGVMSISSASNSTSVKGLVCTDPSPVGGGAYVRAEGFVVSNAKGGTMGTAELVVQQLFDNSVFRDIAVVDPSSLTTSRNAMSVMGVCCGTSFYNITVDCYSRMGCTPLVLGGTTTGAAVSSTAFFGLSPGHPGAGIHNIVIGAYNQNENIDFYNSYLEPNSTDTSTAGVEIGAGANDINFYGAMFSNVARGSTAFLVDIANWPGPANDTFSGLKSQTLNLVNDQVAGITVRGDPNYGTTALYISGSTTLTSLKTRTLQQTTANQFAGTASCSGGAKTINFPITYSSQPVISIFDETRKGGVSLSSKSTSGFTVSCEGATDIFDWTVIGNPD